MVAITINLSFILSQWHQRVDLYTRYMSRMFREWHLLPRMVSSYFFSPVLGIRLLRTLSSGYMRNHILMTLDGYAMKYFISLKNTCIPYQRQNILYKRKYESFIDRASALTYKWIRNKCCWCCDLIYHISRIINYFSIASDLNTRTIRRAY